MGLFNMTDGQVNKQLKILENSIEMFEKTKRETEREMRNKLDENGNKKYTKDDIKEQLEVIQTAEDDQLVKYKMFGGDADELLRRLSSGEKKVTTGKRKSMEMLKNIKVNDVDFNAMLAKKTVNLGDVVKEREQQEDTVLSSSEDKSMDKINISVDNDGLSEVENITSTFNGETFDVIPLPSNGQAYSSKISKLPVAYLTAYDENMIVSPNLYRDNLIIDYLLKAKIKNQTIDPMDMLECDREAVILFLRASAYGNEYPVSAKDKATGENFDAVVDLSKIKYKEFNLVGDENGWFDFTLPISKKEVKFKFLTHRDNETLRKLREIEKQSLAKDRLSQFVKDMDEYVENDQTLEKTQKVKIRQAIREIDRWQDSMDNDSSQLFTHDLTNKLEMQIMSIDGVTDRDYISDFIEQMNVKDSFALRKYINENEPGLDYTVTVEKPESLGGGSTEVFLKFDEFIFLNVA